MNYVLQYRIGSVLNTVVYTGSLPECFAYIEHQYATNGYSVGYRVVEGEVETNEATGDMFPLSWFPEPTFTVN